MPFARPDVPPPEPVTVPSSGTVRQPTARPTNKLLVGTPVATLATLAGSEIWQTYMAAIEPGLAGPAMSNLAGALAGLIAGGIAGYFVKDRPNVVAR